eukprot:TRINITY_DN1662_c0_g1_i2.p1 TRINITY_DN1662_c0_g1~~TRINITY_DN1662_c0_g1_i2.p1  ORF type:complete len:317 (+),score=43.77 TRINITY_DN1662_c0_g1_i2:100-1050(+)
MAHSVEGTLKEFTKKKLPLAPRPAESPFGDFPPDWSRPGPKGSQTTKCSTTRLPPISPNSSVVSPVGAASHVAAVPNATSSSPVAVSPLTKNSGFGGANSSLMRSRRAPAAQQGGSSRDLTMDTEGGGGPPKAGAYRPKRISPTKFRVFYERGDLPIAIAHKPTGSQKLDWKIDRLALDYHHYLPIFFDGLREVEDPYAFLARQGATDLLEVGGSRILPTIPQLIIPIKTALNTRHPEVVCTVLKVLQGLVASAELVGEALVPYYRQILPVFALFKNCNRNMGDRMDYGQRKRNTIGDLVEETLQVRIVFSSCLSN